LSKTGIDLRILENMLSDIRELIIESHSHEVHMENGCDLTDPLEIKLNGTRTITIKINGGATDNY